MTALSKSARPLSDAGEGRNEAARFHFLSHWIGLSATV